MAARWRRGGFRPRSAHAPVRLGARASRAWLRGVAAPKAASHAECRQLPRTGAARERPSACSRLCRRARGRRTCLRPGVGRRAARAAAAQRARALRPRGTGEVERRAAAPGLRHRRAGHARGRLEAAECATSLSKFPSCTQNFHSMHDHEHEHAAESRLDGAQTRQQQPGASWPHHAATGVAPMSRSVPWDPCQGQVSGPAAAVLYEYVTADACHTAGRAGLVAGGWAGHRRIGASRGVATGQPAWRLGSRDSLRHSAIACSSTVEASLDRRPQYGQKRCARAGRQHGPRAAAAGARRGHGCRGRRLPPAASRAAVRPRGQRRQAAAQPPVAGRRCVAASRRPKTPTRWRGPSHTHTPRVTLGWWRPATVRRLEASVGVLMCVISLCSPDAGATCHCAGTRAAPFRRARGARVGALLLAPTPVAG